MLADWFAMVTDRSVFVGMWVGSESYIVNYYFENVLILTVLPVI